MPALLTTVRLNVYAASYTIFAVSILLLQHANPVLCQQEDKSFADEELCVVCLHHANGV